MAGSSILGGLIAGHDEAAHGVWVGVTPTLQQVSHVEGALLILVGTYLAAVSHRHDGHEFGVVAQDGFDGGPRDDERAYVYLIGVGRGRSHSDRARHGGVRDDLRR